MTRGNKIGLSLVIAVAIAISIIGVTAFTTYSLLSGDQPVSISFFGGSDEDNRVRFTNLDKFVISIDGAERTHFLMLEMSLKTSSEEAHDALYEFKPLARNVLLRMFSKKTYEELREIKNIELLEGRVHQELTMALVQNGYNHRIDEVLFTKMVVQ
ncbi:flagellar basal body-associated protein FliL [Thaumasiovibrio sp. DFM-14]|uniref:flagellar basal body-associated FliL family protein n=1 Tax=Thaumasiovibrio sp. DFM-14 TaxID=3384792 RepID=UPI0039A2B4E0